MYIVSVKKDARDSDGFLTDLAPHSLYTYNKGHNYCKHVTSPHGKENGRSIPDDCERTATVVLPTAASPELLVDNHSSIAALDAFCLFFSRR